MSSCRAGVQEVSDTEWGRAWGGGGGGELRKAPERSNPSCTLMETGQTPEASPEVSTGLQSQGCRALSLGDLKADGPLLRAPRGHFPSWGWDSHCLKRGATGPGGLRSAALSPRPRPHAGRGRPHTGREALALTLLPGPQLQALQL